jgi:hypothetical protein
MVRIYFVVAIEVLTQLSVLVHFNKCSCKFYNLTWLWNKLFLSKSFVLTWKLLRPNVLFGILQAVIIFSDTNDSIVHRVKRNQMKWFIVIFFSPVTIQRRKSLLVKLRGANMPKKSRHSALNWLLINVYLIKIKNIIVWNMNKCYLI